MPSRPQGITASVKAFAKWAFWRVWYFVLPAHTGSSRQFAAFLVRLDRTSWPWRVFKPYVYRNAIGTMWQVYLSDESTYTERRTLDLDVHISRETGDIIGFNVFDETLKGDKK